MSASRWPATDVVAAMRAVARPLVIGGSLAGLAVALFLLAHDLEATGFTWDEAVDYQMASGFRSLRAVTRDLADPTQGRLPVLISALARPFLGGDLAGFKSTWLLVSLATLGMWVVVARAWLPPLVALATTSLLATNAFFVDGARTAATAGDGLVITATLGIAWAARRAVDRPTVPSWLVLGVVLGLSLGAKLSMAPLIAAVPLLLVGLVRSVPLLRRGLLLGATGLGLVPAFLASHPVLLAGPAYVRALLDDVSTGGPASISPIGAEASLLAAVAADASYLAQVAVAKLSLPGTALVLLALGAAIRAWRRDAQPDRAVAVVAAWILVGSLSFTIKDFQNPHYYNVWLVPGLLLAARLLATAPGSRAAIAAWILASAMLVNQAAVGLAVHPDHLQAGREWGPSFQGQFFGPAVNHCQGSVGAVRELNRVAPGFGAERAYLFGPCESPLTASLRAAGIEPVLPLEPYPTGGMLPTRYALLVATPNLYDLLPAPEIERLRAELGRAVAPCMVQEAPLDTFQVYVCETTGP